MYRKNSRNRSRFGATLSKLAVFLVVLGVLTTGLFFVHRYFFADTVEQAVDRLLFDTTVAETEQELIQQTLLNQEIIYQGDVEVSVTTALEKTSTQNVLAVYVPVTALFSPLQNISTEISPDKIYYADENIDQTTQNAIAETLGVNAESLQSHSVTEQTIDTNQIVFIPIEQLNDKVKLLSVDGNYYLDSFTNGAIFRSVVFSGDDTEALTSVTYRSFATSEDTLKVNMTGVTALTRVMLRKLQEVRDPLYFSEYIGEFLSDADITHTTNEVSFRENCQYNNTLFCSLPEFLETLKASGINLVDLSGNHNNDFGHELNTQTINLYESLGWNVIGGGRNAEEAREPFIASQKNSKVAFLAYNFPDSPGSGVIAGATTAGANSFESLEKVREDVANAKTEADFVIVNVHFWECYAYPDGYVEYPLCDSPIGEQQAVFRGVADSGADMVVGTSAHQPQTYELYNETPIYYGLGNLYFEQTRWPGTERSIVLTHYFIEGALVQTKMTPTVYDRDLQTRLMDDVEADFLLKRLYEARSQL